MIPTVLDTYSGLNHHCHLCVSFVMLITCRSGQGYFPHKVPYSLNLTDCTLRCRFSIFSPVLDFCRLSIGLEETHSRVRFISLGGCTLPAPSRGQGLNVTWS